MAKHLVLVAGNIGSGKTSLTEKLGERLNWRTSYESVADNPYLPDFYADMTAWAFHLQVYFLGHRAQQHREAAADPRSAILDRSIYEDYHIFTRALVSMGAFRERDLHSYSQIYEQVVRSLPAPDLLLYLKAPVEVLMERIHSRARDIESSIDADYLGLLESYYQEWMEDFDICPVLTISTSDEDFVHEPRHLDFITERIQDKLAGKEALVFPKA